MSRPVPTPPTGRRWTALRMLGMALTLTAAQAHGPLHEEISRLTLELRQQPDDPARLARRGELLQLHGLPDQALADFEQLARLRPKDITNDFRLGQARLELGQTNDAVVLLTRFATHRPASVTGHLILARALVRAGQPMEASQHFARVIALSPEPLPDWFLEQFRALRSADVPVADQAACLNAGIGQLGPLPVLVLPAVDLEVRRGNIDRALALLDALAARAERKERWLSRRGDVLLEAGRTQEARAEFVAARRALDSLPDRLQRAWTATELRQQLDAKLAALTPAADAQRPTSP